MGKTLEINQAARSGDVKESQTTLELKSSTSPFMAGDAKKMREQSKSVLYYGKIRSVFSIKRNLLFFSFFLPPLTVFSIAL